MIEQLTYMSRNIWQGDRFLFLLLVIGQLTASHAWAKQQGIQLVSLNVDYEEFLSQQDLIWDSLPDKWQVAPYTGNGSVGFLFYQAEGDANNVISVHMGRHDYYDHRLPYKGEEMLWIYRSRLPLGRFKIESIGEIKDVELRLGLWNAELEGRVNTTRGSYDIRGITHSSEDVIYFETDAKAGESIKITWHADVPYPPVRKALDAGQGPKAPNWDRMRNAPMPMPPEVSLSQADGMQFSFQALYKHRGETTTGWQVSGEADGKQYLTASVHHSFPEKNSMDVVKANLSSARAMLSEGNFFSTHRAWWHDYYPQSFLSVGEPEKEAFYWIQMYKFASASRGNGPILDLMGPWYHETFWPMVWGDLNVQLIYWTHLTANRMELGESLVNNIDKYADNLAANVSADWSDSAALGALFPQDMVSANGKKVPDMLAWLLHDYWLHCVYAGDEDRLRDGLFPILRKTANSYLNYFRDNPLVDPNGTIHIRNSWSPEYPSGHGQDVNFTIALITWTMQTLLNLNETFALNDPLAKDWQHVLDNLVEFQIDENGLRIGKDIAFEKPHRHYSHLLAMYPLAVLTPESEEDRLMLRTSVDHWLDVTINSGIKVQAMPVTGYTATGASSMYSMLGDRKKAYEYLDFFINHKNVSPTTMYAEGWHNPVIESPLSYATSMHDMLLQSWGDKIRVFPATPPHWKNMAFYQLRTQGAFLVSAKKVDGATQFVEFKSLKGNPFVFTTDITEPKFYLNGMPLAKSKVKTLNHEFLSIELQQGDRLLVAPATVKLAELSIDSRALAPKDRNLFGLSEKTKRLPSHHFYYGKKSNGK